MSDINKIRRAQIAAAERAVVSSLPPELRAFAAAPQPSAEPSEYEMVQRMIHWDRTTPSPSRPMSDTEYMRGLLLAALGRPVPAPVLVEQADALVRAARTVVAEWLEPNGMRAMLDAIEALRRALDAIPATGEARDAKAPDFINEAEAENFAYLTRSVMVVCRICGNKRCPKASDPALACTGSNEPGQPGTAMGDAPEAKGGGR